MERRAFYIHFEGMDLAGKTTATRNFIEATGREWDVRRNSVVLHNPIYLLADTLRRADAYDAEVLGNLYVAALMADIRSFNWPTADTIQDSTIILRSLSYHAVRGTSRIVQVFEDLLSYHPKFDASFVFTASLKVRLARLEERSLRQPEQVSPEDLFVRDKPEKFLAMEEVLVSLSQKYFHSVVVDTSEMTPSEVVQRILQRLPAPIGPA